jgi:outer membrane protein
MQNNAPGRIRKDTDVKILIPLIMLLLLPLMADAEDIIKQGELLGIERCIEIALKRHPGITSAANTVSVNRSRVGEAKADYYPHIDGSSGYSRIYPASEADSSALSDAANSYDQYTGSVTLKQNIYDFGKTAAQVQVRSLDLDSSRSDLRNVSGQVVLNVRKAYYGVLKAMRDRDVAEEAVKQFNQHLEQAKGFYEVGTKPRFDVTKAEVDLSSSKLNLIKASNALRVAVVTLNNAMGVPDAPEYSLEDNLSADAYGITIEEAIRKAYENRPDLGSAILKKQAAERSVILAEKGHYPVLNGNASYNWTGENFPLNEGWNAGVTLSIPIFTGFLTTHQIEGTKATLKVQSANEELLRQAVFLEVQQAYLKLTEAGESIPVAELIVRQAEENLDLANGRYAAGLGNPVEVTDAQVSLSSAKTSYIQALYDYKIAHASLEKAMGVR